MALTVHCLGSVRSEWAAAMQVEFEAARADGKPLSFAVGCLAAAWAELPRHAEGRFAIANYLLGIAVIVPAAGMLISQLIFGFPFSYLQYGHPVLSDGNHSAVPSLVVLLACLAACQLRLAWLTVERDWERLSWVGALTLAAALTLLIFTTVVFGDYLAALVQTGVVAVELRAVSVLACWHARLHANALPAAPPNYS